MEEVEVEVGVEGVSRNHRPLIPGPPCPVCGGKTRRRGYTKPRAPHTPVPRWRCEDCGKTRTAPEARLRRATGDIANCPCGRGKLLRIGRCGGFARLRCSYCAVERRDSLEQPVSDGLLPE